METVSYIYEFSVRFIFPLISLLFLVFNFKTIFHNLKRKTLAKFAIGSFENVVEIKSSECIIGKGLFCDVRIKDSRVANQHAVVSLNDYGFMLTPLSEENKVYINDCLVEEAAYLTSGDRIQIGNTILQIAINPAISKKAKQKSSEGAKKSRRWSLILLTAFQFFAAISLIIKNEETQLFLAAAFGGMILLEWVYLMIRGFKSNIGVEICAFFLTTVGFCMCADSGIDILFKQIVMFLIGFVGFILLGLILKNIDLITKFQIPIMALSLALFAYNLLFGVYINGSKNWVMVGDFSFQPSELIKVALVFIGACSLEKMMKIKSLFSFLAFSFICLLSLAIMRDFGTALVYFSAILIILCLRLCDIKIVALISSGAALCGFAAIKLFPYISARFAVYRHAWEYASSGGYQQTQTMMSAASGGLLGLGLENGRLSFVSAADTDLVFGMVAEELGLIFAVSTVLIFALFIFYAAVCIPRTRSIYYAVTASAAAGIFITQAILNIFGSVDLLPLTGVTLPFISNGGSSMIASWLLLSFIKTAGSQFVSLDSSGGDQK